jgi:GNAT superfamily N-acetyltransferase
VTRRCRISASCSTPRPRTLARPRQWSRVRSYDTLALVAVASRPFQATTIGVNCTAWLDERYDPPRDFAARSGRPGDLSTLVDIGPGLFGAPAEAAQDLAGGRITIYEMDGAPVGCGILSPVREGADAFDLGVGILPQWRRKGFGEQIVRHLKRVFLRELDVRPVCGCAVENIASRLAPHPGARGLPRPPPAAGA